MAFQSNRIWQSQYWWLYCKTLLHIAVQQGTNIYPHPSWSPAQLSSIRYFKVGSLSWHLLVGQTNTIQVTSLKYDGNVLMAVTRVNEDQKSILQNVWMLKSVVSSWARLYQSFMLFSVKNYRYMHMYNRVTPHNSKMADRQIPWIRTPFGFSCHL